MEFGLIIKNVLILGAIVGGVAFSQQPYFRSHTTDYVYSEGSNNIDKYVKNVTNWVQSKVSPKTITAVSGAVGKTNAVVASSASAQIETQKNKLQKNSFDSAKKFIAQEVLQILGVKAQDLGASCKAN